MPDYQKGKIYKIVCNITNKIYIGSTCQNRLSYRLNQHVRKRNTSSKEIIEGGNYNIILIENHPCNNKDELCRRERHYIETLECVNKCIPGRTKKEYHETYKEHYREQSKQYRENNKERTREYNKQHYQKNKEAIAEKKKKK